LSKFSFLAEATRLKTIAKHQILDRLMIITLQSQEFQLSITHSIVNYQRITLKFSTNHLKMLLPIEFKIRFWIPFESKNEKI